MARYFTQNLELGNLARNVMAVSQLKGVKLDAKLKSCISCKKSETQAELHKVFDDLYYCRDCMERYRIPLPEKPKMRTDDDYDWGF